MQEHKEEIIRRISAGESLRSVCQTEGFPSAPTVIRWTTEDEAFAEQYARACEARADTYFDKLDDIGSDAEKAESAVQVAGLRLKADNIKWQLARMAPKKYGDKLAIGGADDLPTIKQSLTVEFVKGAND
jgi:hypothetical protein